MRHGHVSRADGLCTVHCARRYENDLLEMHAQLSSAKLRLSQAEKERITALQRAETAVRQSHVL